MQLERYATDDGRRVRLTESERDRLIAVYEGEPGKEIALSLMGKCGCRSQEALDVRPHDAMRGDETNRWFSGFPRAREPKSDRHRCRLISRA